MAATLTSPLVALSCNDASSRTCWDASGNGHHFFSSSASANMAGGSFRRLRSANSGYLFLPDHLDAQVRALDYFTIAYRVRFRDLPAQSTTLCGMHNHTTGGGKFGLWMYRVGTGGNVNKIVLYASTDGSANNTALSTGTVVVDRWYTVVARYDGTNIILNLDSATKVTDPHTGGWNKPANTCFEIGSYIGSAGVRVNSDIDIDNFNIWSGALSDEDVATWINSGDPLRYPFTDTIGTTLGGGNPLPVLAIFGQSNAAGIADEDDLTAARRYPKVHVWDNGYNWSGSTDSDYDGFQPATSDPKDNGQFGPEVGVAEAFRSNLAIVKYAAGGSALADIGSNNWSADGNQRGHAITHMTAALADLRAAGYKPYVAAIHWGQGEADAADTEATADAYEDNLTAWVAWARAQWGVDLPVFVTRLSQTVITDEPLPYGATVRAAQDAVAATDSLVWVIDADDYGIGDDDLHLNAAGQIAQGEDIATLLRARLNEAATGTDRNIGTAVRSEMERNGSKVDHLWELTEDDGSGTRELTDAVVGQIAVGVGARAGLAIGVVEGFPTEIIQGDSWETVVDRGIAIKFRDTEGRIITGFGTKTPSDSDFTWELRFYPSPVVPSVAAVVEVSGDENDWNVTDPLAPFLRVELTSTNTAALTVPTGKAVAEYAWQLVMKWTGYQYTAKGTTRVRALIGDPA